MKTISKILLVCLLGFLVTQCDLVSKDLLQNPNNPSPEQVSPDFLLNQIQTKLPEIFRDLQNSEGSAVRMYHMSGQTYQDAYDAGTTNSEWGDAYSDALEDIKTLIPITEEKQLYSHEGVARIIRAYILLALVDEMGPIPLSEALNPNILNPKVDPGKDVYAYAMADLDSAITDLGKDALAMPSNDLYYGQTSDPDAAWIRLANTLKLKILFQTRLVSDNTSKINALLNGGNIIEEPGQQFVFRYSTTNANPDSRSIQYGNNYTPTGAGTYMSDYFMNVMLNRFSVPDPRIRYYFYRQTNTKPTDTNLQSCLGTPVPTHFVGVTGDGKNGDDPYCSKWNDIGYWGRDHGIDIGIPPDGFLRTTYGVYPYGGRFDANQAEGVERGQGLKGAGIQPFWMPFYTDYVRAITDLMLNNDAAKARADLEAAVTNSINFVIAFAKGDNPTGTNAVTLEANGLNYASTATNNIPIYVQAVLDEYDAASGKQAKLNTIAREYYIALWGNGWEAYNLYRLVAPAQHAPNWHLQPNINPNPGQFPMSFLYPSNFTERNNNAKQKPGLGIKIFWDTQSGDFANF